MRVRQWVFLACLALVVPVAAACAYGAAPSAATSRPAGTSPSPTSAPASTPASTGGGAAVRIGSKNFTEQLIVGEMYAQILEANGIKVDRKLNLGGTIVAHNALKNGDIDLYPEYTGTALLAILNEKTMSDPTAVYQEVAKQYKQQFNLVWLDQSPMNDTQALAVTQQTSQQRSLTTISQMVAMASQLVLAAVPDFPDREDGLVGLKNVYGNFQFKDIKIFDPGIKYQALLNGQADVVVAFGTDGQINGYKLVVLQDDKGLWPPYHIAPVVRQDALDKNPNIKVLNNLAPLLTSDVMQQLNWKVDGPDKADPATVARDFLKSKGLVQ
jgi:osmoprotectant transport system substrate-binding protein